MAALATLYSAENSWRVDLIRQAIAQGRGGMNGLATLAVSLGSAGGQATLGLGFLADAATLGLRPENLAIESADGSRPFRVIEVKPAQTTPPGLTVMVSGPIDNADYTLRLVSSPTDSHPPRGIDPLLTSIEFAFRSTAAAGDDQLDMPVDALVPPAAHIDYLAKDYQSFLRLMLDRLAVLRPDWQERNPADLGVMLVEMLAYVADQTSYYQDAVATEAYLTTARRRISVRRHARLLDYPMHDGRNARVFLAVTVQKGVEGLVLSGSTLGSANTAPRQGAQFLSRLNVPRVVPTASDLQQAVTTPPQIFEAMHDLSLYEAHNEIPIHTWGQRDAILPAGSTRTTLIASALKLKSGGYSLVAGDLLLLEERALPDCPSVPAPELSRRHVVRLIRVSPQQDPLFSDLVTPSDPLALIDVEWAQDDALPFALNLNTVAEDSGLAQLPLRRKVAVARGNIVIADHGQTLPAELLQALPDSVTRAGYDYAALQHGSITQQGTMKLASGMVQPLDVSAPASAAMSCPLGSVHPAVSISDGPSSAPFMQTSRDLLEVDPRVEKFVVEVDDEGRGHLRFRAQGAAERLKTPLFVTYRVGTGRAGNVGAESIAHIVLPQTPRPGIVECQANQLLAVRNPLPAVGGEDPESIADVRLKAPQAYRVQQRAVTPDDYALLLMSHPEVRQARVTRRFTGTSFTLFLYVDRRGGLIVDDAFQKRLLGFLEPYRMASHQLRIEGPHFVPLELSLTVTARESARQVDVQSAVQAALGVEVLPGNRRGFFHPEEFGFAQPVYLSRLLSTVMELKGVASVYVRRFRRYGDSAESGMVEQRLEMKNIEIARLNARTGQPNRDGVLHLVVEGGR